MGRRRILPVLFLLAAVLLPVADTWAEDDVATAEEDSLDQAWADDVEEQDSWLDRLLHRYFGKAPATGEELGGRAERVIDSYADYQGKRIAVVIVQSVLKFDKQPEAEEGSASSTWLSSLGNRFQSFTRESVLRQYLLFEAGDTLDPFDLADTERLIRRLEFINDARILILPVGGTDEDAVAVVVEYRDRWPIGIRSKIITGDRFNLGVYSTNLFGHGILFDNTAIINRARSPEVGYLGILGRENLGGTFIDGSLSYEDSWNARAWSVRLNRGIRHHRIRWVGGVNWEGVDSHDNGGVPYNRELTDHWVGYVAQLDGTRDPNHPARRTLTPAFNFRRSNFLDRPEGVGVDTLHSYHNRRHNIVGLTFQKRTDVKTSYLFRMGEVEDLPHGMSIQVAGGYENAEFADRVTGSLTMAGISVRERGDVIAANIGLGGYWRTGEFEDGVFDVGAFYVTQMLPTGRYNWRIYLKADYTLGINRLNPDGIYLGNRSGIRDLAEGHVRGDQRLVLKFETRVFTPWRLLGFDIMTMLYGDAGVVGSERDAVLESKIYSALGLGFRFYNPDLVLPTFELRFGLLQNVDNASFGFKFDLGNAHFPEIIFLVVKPVLAPYL